VTCLNVQGNVALMTIRRLDTGSLGSLRITDNGPGVLDVVEANFGPGCPQPQPFYFNEQHCRFCLEAAWMSSGYGPPPVPQDFRFRR
jgi:hypothetical protein